MPKCYDSNCENKVVYDDGGCLSVLVLRATWCTVAVGVGAVTVSTWQPLELGPLLACK
jgi:hypothetical protein